jgi:hypothetical protein
MAPGAMCDAIDDVIAATRVGEPGDPEGWRGCELTDLANADANNRCGQPRIQLDQVAARDL